MRAVATRPPGMHPQGNRISKQSEELVEIGIVPAGALERAAQGAFGEFFLHDVQCDVPQHRDVVWAVVVWAEVVRLLEDLSLVQNELDRRLAVARTADLEMMSKRKLRIP